MPEYQLSEVFIRRQEEEAAGIRMVQNDIVVGTGEETDCVLNLMAFLPQPLDNETVNALVC